MEFNHSVCLGLQVKATERSIREHIGPFLYVHVVNYADFFFAISDMILLEDFKRHLTQSHGIFFLLY